MNVWTKDAIYRWKVTTPAVVLPRSEHGIDYGAARILLAETKDALIWWQLGHTGWYCVGQTAYYPAGLHLRPKSPFERIGKEALFEGRFSKNRALEFAPQIAEHFGLPVDAIPALSRSQTLTFLGKKKRTKKQSVMSRHRELKGER